MQPPWSPRRRALADSEKKDTDHPIDIEFASLRAYRKRADARHGFFPAHYSAAAHGVTNIEGSSQLKERSAP